MNTYRVVISGNVLPGHAQEDAVGQFARLVRRDASAIAPLLSGRPATIKSAVDEATGSRYVAALRAIGVEASLEGEALDIEVASEPQVPPAAAVRERATGQECPQCQALIPVQGMSPGSSVRCPNCHQATLVVGSAGKAPAPQHPVNPVTHAGNDAARRIEDSVDSAVKALIGDQQDPQAVQEIYSKVSEILTREEVVLYVAVQNKPVMNVRPDAIVLTNRRFIVYQPKFLGRADFADFVWRDLKNVTLKEGMLGATISAATIGGRVYAMEYLPKTQARRLYAKAQEMEERVAEERRARELEERRASAGGIVMQGAGLAGSAPPDDPVQKLKQLKEMADAGLISAGEYEAKRQSILARM